MSWKDHLGAQFRQTSDGGVEVLDLEPEQNAVAAGQVGVPNVSMVVGNVPRVELKNQLVPGDELFVVAATMCPPASQEALVPAAARCDVADTDERLRTHEWCLQRFTP